MADATDRSGIHVRCRCGAVHGRAAVTARSVNRVVCYCDDCQAFAHHLGRAELLDAHGGSDIVQMPPAALVIDQGHEKIGGLQLSAKGLYRWYTTCCQTPLGNTVSPAIPFVGVMSAAFDFAGASADQMLGKPVGAIMGQFAVGEAPAGSRGIRLPLMLRSIGKVLGWRLSGRAWPHPFFERASGKPVYPVTVLSPEQREALRPLCGPTAKTTAAT